MWCFTQPKYWESCTDNNDLWDAEISKQLFTPRIRTHFTSLPTLKSWTLMFWEINSRWTQQFQRAASTGAQDKVLPGSHKYLHNYITFCLAKSYSPKKYKQKKKIIILNVNCHLQTILNFLLLGKMKKAGLDYVYNIFIFLHENWQSHKKRQVSLE